ELTPSNIRSAAHFPKLRAVGAEVARYILKMEMPCQGMNTRHMPSHLLRTPSSALRPRQSPRTIQVFGQLPPQAQAFPVQSRLFRSLLGFEVKCKTRNRGLQNRDEPWNFQQNPVSPFGRSPNDAVGIGPGGIRRGRSYDPQNEARGWRSAY